MNELNIFFFALGSFFGIEDGRIAADKTTVRIYPQEQEMEIIQEKLFALIQSENDKALVLEQWEKIYNWKSNNTTWSQSLNGFPGKNLTFTAVKMTNQTDHVLIRPHLTLKYADEKALSSMGIWYNAEKNQFYINHIPESNLKSENGRLEGNYWVFDAEQSIIFTVEPFLNKNEKFNDSKVPLKKILLKQN